MATWVHLKDLVGDFQLTVVCSITIITCQNTAALYKGKHIFKSLNTAQSCFYEPYIEYKNNKPGQFGLFFK